MSSFIIPHEALNALKAVHEFGQSKYGQESVEQFNWLEKNAPKTDHTSMYNSLFHHIADGYSKTKEDHESKLPPEWHAFYRLMMLITRQMKGIVHDKDIEATDPDVFDSDPLWEQLVRVLPDATGELGGDGDTVRVQEPVGDAAGSCPTFQRENTRPCQCSRRNSGRVSREDGAKRFLKTQTELLEAFDRGVIYRDTHREVDFSEKE